MRKLILASASPRRKEILEKFDVGFEIKHSNIDEIIRNDESAASTVMANAYRKAKSVAQNYNSEIIIGADTVVYLEEILGKPKDRGQAELMLKRLSGNEHSVITGISIIDMKNNITLCDYEETIVCFRELDKDTIDNYLSVEDYSDKAGSYAIQERGEVLVERIWGSYSNVVGLPIYLLEKNLNIIEESLLT